MQTLIKKIRQYLNISQLEFADKLGVTFATINRWENGKAFPNNLAQNTLYEFCKNNNVPVYEIILEKIENEVNSLKLDSDCMILYHGSKSGIKGEIAPISRSRCDFGAGFYMGTDPSQPLTLVCDFDKSVFYIMSIKLDNLSVCEIPTNLDWAMVVAYNRGKLENIRGSVLYDKYSHLCEGNDIIVGSIADDRMFFVLDNFFEGNITDVALINSLSALQLGKQYVAVSKQGCSSVRIEKELVLSDFERKFIKDASEKNRVLGIKIANDICRNHRRDGLFFDEILETAEEK